MMIETKKVTRCFSTKMIRMPDEEHKRRRRRTMDYREANQPVHMSEPLGMDLRPDDAERHEELKDQLRDQDRLAKEDEMPGLVLQRKVGEKIVIGGNIVITVSKIEVADNREPRIWLDIEVPKYIRVDREEVHESRRAKR